MLSRCTRTFLGLSISHLKQKINCLSKMYLPQHLHTHSGQTNVASVFLDGESPCNL